MDHLTSFTFISNQQEAEDLLELLKSCERLIEPQLIVRGELSAEAWAALAKAVELHPGTCGIVATRSALLAGRKENLNVPWEAVRWVDVTYSQDGSPFTEEAVFIEKEEGWERLEQVLDMSQDQFKAEALELVIGEEDKEEEEEEEEE